MNTLRWVLIAMVVACCVLPSAGKAQKADRPTVSFNDLLTLVKFSDEDKILETLRKSSPSFILGADQEKQLKSAGASGRLIEAIRKMSPAERVGEVTDLAIVLDCSGSMSYETSDKRQKMEVAREVTTDLVRKLPNGLSVAFIIYGHETFGPNDTRNCQAVKVVRPLSKLDYEGKQELTKFIDALKPVGHTPIGLALEVAGKELAKAQGSCGLVLITDGMETCHRDPAEEAGKLARNLKMSFGVHVVGFALKPEEQKAVADIARAGKGKYYDAQSSGDLARQIKLVEEKVAEAAKPAEEKKAAATEAQASSTGKRAIRVLKPGINLPPMNHILLADAGTSLNVLGYGLSRSQYDQEIRIPSPKKKYDVWWVPKEGNPVVILNGFSLEQNKVVDIKPEEHLGLVQVSGEGKVERIIVAKAGTSANVIGYGVQHCKKFGVNMIVPAGDYDVYVDGNLREEGLKVEAGRLYKIE